MRPPGGAAALLVALSLAGPARADPEPVVPLGAAFGPGPARVVSLGLSASRDAPVFELAYGPYAQASLGGEVGLFRYRDASTTVRLGLSGLVALENGDSAGGFPPEELCRAILGATWALSLDRFARTWFGPRSAFELSFLVGLERDGQSASYLPDPPRPWDIPFGEGGSIIQPGIALRTPLSRNLDVTLRIRDRFTVSGIVDAVGQKVASDVVAGYLQEGLLQVPGAEAGLRYRAFTRVSGVVSISGEQMIPLQPAQTGFFGRALFGVALAGVAGEVVPFLSLDGGNGQGLLINRRETRMSVGIRYAPF
jgi:hypothetical protein